MSILIKNFILNVTDSIVQCSLIYNFNNKDNKFKIVKFSFYYENHNNFKN